MASSLGPRLRAPRQRAANTSSAVESAPPETASTSVEASANGSNSAFASAAETASSAADTLLFSLDPLLHARRGARKFAQHLPERRAGCLLLAEHGERLSEAEQRIGRLRVRFVFGRDIEEGFRRVTVALALELALAEPESGIAGEPIVGIFAQEVAEAVLGEGIVLAQHVAVGEVVFVARRLRRRQGGGHAGGDATRRLSRRRIAGRPHIGEIERRIGHASTRSADRRVVRIGRSGRLAGRRVDRAERMRRAGRRRILRGIEGVAAPPGRGRCGRPRRHGRTDGTRLYATGRAPLLQAADLCLELLVAELELLDRAGELPDLALEALEPHHQIGARHLCSLLRAGGRGGATFAPAAEALAAAEDAVEQSERTFGFLRLSRGRYQRHRRHDREAERGCRRHTEREACHRCRGMVGALQYHTNPCVQIVTDASLINSATGSKGSARVAAGATRPAWVPAGNSCVPYAIPRSVAPARRTAARTALRGRSTRSCR